MLRTISSGLILLLVWSVFDWLFHRVYTRVDLSGLKKVSASSGLKLRPVTAHPITTTQRKPWFTILNLNNFIFGIEQTMSLTPPADPLKKRYFFLQLDQLAKSPDFAAERRDLFQNQDLWDTICDVSRDVVQSFTKRLQITESDIKKKLITKEEQPMAKPKQVAKLSGSSEFVRAPDIFLTARQRRQENSVPLLSDLKPIAEEDVKKPSESRLIIAFNKAYAKVSAQYPILARMSFSSPLNNVGQDADLVQFVMTAMSRLLVAAVKEDPHGMPVRDITDWMRDWMTCMLALESFMQTMMQEQKRGTHIGSLKVPREILVTLDKAVYRCVAAYGEEMASVVLAPDLAERLQRFVEENMS